MIIDLPAEVLLYQMLKEEPFASRGISHGDLREVGGVVEGVLREQGVSSSVYFLVSNNDLGTAVETHSKYFAWRQQDDRIGRADNSSRFYDESDSGYFSGNELNFSEKDVPKKVSDVVLGTIRGFEFQ